MSQTLRKKVSCRIGPLMWINWVLLFGIPVPSQGASFDCAQAKSFAEKSICSDPELSKLDDNLAVRYREVLNKNRDQKSVRTDQREWLRERNTCSSTSCLSKTYKLRIDQLQKILMNAEDNKIAVTVQDGKKSKMRIYKPHPEDCYVQLKPTGNEQPYIRGGDYPVCRVVLKNFNKFCNELPPYNRRKLHPTIIGLEEPSWKPLVPKNNMDIVKAVVTVVGNSDEEREIRWSGYEQRITKLAEAGVLRLWVADVDIDLDGNLESVYLLENMYPDDPPQNNQPTFMIAKLGERVQSKMASKIGYEAYGDLWRAADQFGVLRWHSINLEPGTSHFLVQEMGTYSDGIHGVTMCVIDYIENQ